MQISNKWQDILAAVGVVLIAVGVVLLGLSVAALITLAVAVSGCN